MNKAKALKILNPILGLLVLNQLVIGALHGSLPHIIFEVMHVGGGLVLVLGVVIHLILNWGWVRVNFFKKNSSV